MEFRFTFLMLLICTSDMYGLIFKVERASDDKIALNNAVADACRRKYNALYGDGKTYCKCPPSAPFFVTGRDGGTPKCRAASDVENWPHCVYKLGDITGGHEFKFSEQSNPEECATDCKKKNNVLGDTITGVTIDKTTGRRCYCETGNKRTQQRTSYWGTSCMFDDKCTMGWQDNVKLVQGSGDTFLLKLGSNDITCTTMDVVVTDVYLWNTKITVKKAFPPKISNDGRFVSYPDAIEHLRASYVDQKTLKLQFRDSNSRLNIKGLLMKIVIRCRQGHSYCTLLKFAGKRTYPFKLNDILKPPISTTSPNLTTSKPPIKRLSTTTTTETSSRGATTIVSTTTKTLSTTTQVIRKSSSKTSPWTSNPTNPTSVVVTKGSSPKTQTYFSTTQKTSTSNPESGKRKSGRKNDKNLLYIIIGILAGALVAVIIGLSIYCRRRSKASTGQKTAHEHRTSSSGKSDETMKGNKQPVSRSMSPVYATLDDYADVSQVGKSLSLQNAGYSRDEPHLYERAIDSRKQSTTPLVDCDVTNLTSNGAYMQPKYTTADTYNGLNNFDNEMRYTTLQRKLSEEGCTDYGSLQYPESNNIYQELEVNPSSSVETYQSKPMYHEAENETKASDPNLSPDPLYHELENAATKESVHPIYHEVEKDTTYSSAY